MTKERENEIRQMSRDEQKDLLFELRKKNSFKPISLNQPIPMHNATDLVATDEEIELLEDILYPDKNA